MAVPAGGENGLQLDHKLLFDIQYLSSAGSVHTIANLIGAYRTAIGMYNEDGDAAFGELAFESERCLRILLTELRLQKAVGHEWDRFVDKG